MSKISFYRCGTCGNIVALIKVGGGTLTCCGQPMELLEANTVDASKEKHVPAITKEAGKIKVAVGAVLHPMLEEHHIEWIALVAEDRVEIRYLKPGDEPVAEFEDAESGEIYEYCNIHGLWKAKF